MLRTQDRPSSTSPSHSRPQFSYRQPCGEAPEIPPPSYRVSVQDKPSLDLPRRIEQKLAQYNASQSVFKCWLFEIISITTSAVCMGAIVGLLSYLDNQSLHKWPPGLTIITILSKLASGALILPISEAIGQLKWAWFHGKESKDAFDFEIFDKASRGAWGSFMLLCRTKGRSLAALGALLTVLLLAIDTFFQQVSDLQERWKLQGESFIPRVVRYEPNLEYQYESTLDGLPVALTNTELWRGLGPFFYDQNGTRALTIGNATQAEIPLVCPTSRCEWPPYETLGVCSACEDVSHLLDYACITSKLDWIRNATGPGMNPVYPKGLVCGYFLNATSEDPILMSGFRTDNSTNSIPGETLLMRTLPLRTNPLRQPLYGGTINFEHVQYRLLDAIIASSIDGSADSVYEKKRPIAQECMLSWCVKTLRSSYESGNYEEETEEIFMNTTKADWPWRIQNHPEFKTTETEFKTNISIRPPSLAQDKAAFGVSNETFLDVVTILDEIFPSMLTISNSTAPPFIKVDTSYVDHVVFRSVRFSPWLAPNNVTRHLERMAEAMTNVIRSNTDSTELVAGAAYARETYVAVHWAFLTFPLVMLVLSVIFLAATIFKTSNDSQEGIGTWKTSTMPTLMYSLPKETQDQVMSTTHPRDATGKSSSKVRIRLLPNQGWRISGQLSPRPAPPPGFI